jgi:hypothetical protein
MKKTLRPKKLVLKFETIRQLEAKQLGAAKGGAITDGWGCYATTTIFSEGACETYSWWYACNEAR